MKIHKTKCLILGSGPAGCSAAIYASRANLEPILLHGPQAGGQLTITTEVENYPGFISVQGGELMENMHKHAETYGAKVVQDLILEADLRKRPFILKGEGTIYEADSLIISTGASAKWLGLESEKFYQGQGVSGCATCDAFFFKNKIVAVVGGGNTALTEAEHLTHHASKVYLIHRREEFRAEKIMIDRIKKNSKIELILNSEVKEILGKQEGFKKFVTGIKIEDTKNKKESLLELNGIFIAIGHKPNTDLFKDQLKMDNEGYILTEGKSTKTNVEGVFAAGDVQDKIYRQAITSAGTGCMAALDAQNFLNSK